MPKVVDHSSRRTEIADAVLDVIAREGTASVTLRAVSDVSGWSTGTLNHYAKNREGLLKIAIERAASSTRKIYLQTAQVDGESGPFTRLEKILSETLPLDERRLALTRIFIFYFGEAVADPALGEELREYLRNWRHDVEAEVVHLMQAGSIPADRDAKAISLDLVALADGFGNQATIDEELLNELRANPPASRWINFVLSTGGKDDSAVSSIA